MAPESGSKTSVRTSNLSSMLRIRDVYPGSEFFSSRILSKNLRSRKYDPGCSYWIRIPGPDPDFYPSRITDPGSRGQKGTGSRIRIRNTVYLAEAGSAGRDSDGYDAWVSRRYLAPLRHVRQATSNTDPRTPRFLLLYIIVLRKKGGNVNACRHR
jgi:hypothetical protein